MLNADNSGFTGGVTLGRGDLFLNNINALTAANSVSLTPVGAGINTALRIWNRSVTIGALSSGGTGHAIISGSGSQAALTVCQNVNTTFGGTLTQQNARQVYTSGCELAFTKDGSGTLTLTAANDYTGATTVKAGTLALGSNGTLSSTNIKIAAGAIFDVAAKTTYNLASANTYTFGVNSAVAGAAGRISAAGLDISNAKVVFDVAGSPDGLFYVLATYTNLTGTAFASVTGRPSGYILDYNYKNTQTIALVRCSGTILQIR